MKKLTLLFCVAIISSQSLLAQSMKKINILIDQKEYSEARDLLLKKKKKDREAIEKLGDCYYYTKNLKAAERWYGKLFRNTKKAPKSDVVFRYAKSLKAIGKNELADKWYNLYSGDNANTSELLYQLRVNNNKPPVVEKVLANSNSSDFAPAFYNNKIVFASARGNNETYEWTNQSYLDLYIGNVDENGDITSAKPLSKEINTDLHESNAVFSADGKTMYFTRNNNKNGKRKRGKNKITEMKIYSAQLVNGIWDNVTELPFNDDAYSVIHPALSPDGKKLYFASDMPGTYGSFDIYVVDINNGNYSEPKNLGDKINTKYAEQFPFISDKGILYFSSDKYDGYGGLDIYKSEVKNNAFATPVNLGHPINSADDDFSYIVKEETGSGYFASNRNSRLADNIYKFNAAPKLFISGTVNDLDTGEILPGTTLKITDLTEVSSTEITVGEDASFSFEVIEEGQYIIDANRDNYQPFNTEITVADASISQPLLLEPIPVENFDFSPIYFEFDKSDVRSQDLAQLDSIVEKMAKHPNRILKLSTYTDALGTGLYNLRLSERRAKSVIDYLKSKGVNPVNIQSKAYGKTKVQFVCKERTQECIEASQKERRCEFDLSTTIENEE